MFFLLSVFICCAEPQKKLQRVCSADFQAQGMSYSLRPIQHGDKTSFDTLTSDARVKKFLPSGLHLPDHWDTFMKRLEQGHPAAGFAVVNSSCEFVGYVLLGMEYAQKYPGTASPLLIIHPDYHRQGVGRAVGKQVEILASKIAAAGQSDPAFHFGGEPLRRIISTCAESNTASEKLMISGGFRQISSLNPEAYGGRPTLWFEKEVVPRSKL